MLPRSSALQALAATRKSDPGQWHVTRNVPAYPTTGEASNHDIEAFWAVTRNDPVAIQRVADQVRNQ